jgi:predicted nucleotidyltransferase
MARAQSLAIKKLTPKENRAIQDFIQSLIKNLGGQVLTMTLFGSKARGDSTSDSDIDLLILTQAENRNLRREISSVSSNIGIDYDVLINTIIISSDRWAQMTQERFSLCRNVERDGIALFSR